MNRIEVAVDGLAEPEWAERLIHFAAAVLDHEQIQDWDLSFLLCTDEVIRRLNGLYRQKDESTDVLSFEQGEFYQDEDGQKRWAAGDIVISLDTLSKNAAYFAVTPDEELRRLVIHGILHLTGLDHADNDPSQPMLVKQEYILQKLGNLHIVEEPLAK